MTRDAPILNRLLQAIADSENDHPGDDSCPVVLSRRDVVDAAKRITSLLIAGCEYATALREVAPDHPLVQMEE